MTLSPVFRSEASVQALDARGYLDRLAPSLAAERKYVARINDLLTDVIAPPYLASTDQVTDDLDLLQDHFFLILFDSVFRSLGCREENLQVYGQLNVCIRGLVVAADNLFDEEAKVSLPLALGDGPRFCSIMQLICFDQLVMRILEDHRPALPAKAARRYQRDLVSSLAAIGSLEGSEEGGVREILPVEEMVNRVHRVRGGQLFGLAFIAPQSWEPTETQPQWETARRGITQIGAAFQIVDDLTDFEFDLTRQSHNILAAQIAQDGTESERAAYAQIVREKGTSTDLVETLFPDAARKVLERARHEVEQGFRALAEIGFWFDPADADLFVRAIAGDEGETRIHTLTGERPTLAR